MPYNSTADVPSYVPKSKRKQWLAVFNSAWKRAKKDGKSDKDAESSAFAQANAVAGPNAKVFSRNEDISWYETLGNNSDGVLCVLQKAVGTKETGFVRAVEGPFKCAHCAHMKDGACQQDEVVNDPEVQDLLNDNGFLPVEPGDCCNEYDPVQSTEKAMKSTLKKFVPFAKVDEAKRQVWGIVTAELPDKDHEVCDYGKSKPFYEAVIAEMSKATDGKNFFPLREMHQLSAVGKGVGFEFRDIDKEIFMGFEVVDDDAWKKVQKGVYTGFSQGGSIVGELIPDPVYDGCMRYVANPSECSLVDNPCLGAAHFAYVKSDGVTELRKLRSVQAVEAQEVPQLIKAAILAFRTELETEGILAKAKTKRVSGEDLPASAFLIVGDKEKTETWKLPIKFSSEAKTKSHIRNALARFNQMKGVSGTEKESAWKRLVAAAKQHGIETDKEKARLDTIHSYLRKRARVQVNRSLSKLAGNRIVSSSIFSLDDDLGRLQKSLYDVSRLACFVNDLGYMVYNAVAEEEWEDDNSPLPEMLRDNVDALMETLVQMVVEETEELKEDMARRVE